MNTISRIGWAVSFLAVAAFFLLLEGCATRTRVSSYGFSRPEQAVSIPHPVEIEKAGNEYVTVFTAILDVGTWGAESVEGAGVWPVLAEQKSAKPLPGYAFVSDLNWWGDYTLQVVMVGEQKSLFESKIIVLDRDGGKVHDLTGKEFNYNPKKFDKGGLYEAEIFQSGMTLSELKSFWKMYTEKRGVDPVEFIAVEEILVGSSQWEVFRLKLAEKLEHNYKMPDGEIKEGFFPLEDFRRQSAKNNGATPGQRFARSAGNLPLIPNPIALVVYAGSVVDGLVQASYGPIQGFYAQAECLRGDLKPNFRLMQKMYKQLLMQRDAVIYGLQQQLEQAQSAPKEEP